MNRDTAMPIASTDILALFNKYKNMIIGLTLASVTLFALAAVTLPKRYKSSFVLSIYSHYFQSPLIRDIMPEIYDSSEMRAQREALIRQALTPEYLDSLGEKYGIYAPKSQGLLGRFSSFLGKKYGVYLTTREMKTRSDERRALIKRIEIINLKSDTFQVSFLHSDPDVTLNVAKDIHEHVTKSLMDARRNNLSALQNAIEKRLNTLANKLPSLDAPPVGSPESARAVPSLPAVEEELADVRSQLRVLTARYTEEHPLVRELRGRERSLSQLAVAAGGSASASAGRSVAVRIPQDAASEIYRELTKKLNYLTVSLDADPQHQADYFATLETPLYPTSPLWPKKGLFLIWGLGAGLIGSLFIAAMREYFDRSALRAPLMSEHLGLPIIGELPLIRWSGALPPGLRPVSTLERMAAPHN
jgi:hypothetical protein